MDNLPFCSVLLLRTYFSSLYSLGTLGVSHSVICVLRLFLTDFVFSWENPQDQAPVFQENYEAMSFPPVLCS